MRKLATIFAGASMLGILSLFAASANAWWGNSYYGPWGGGPWYGGYPYYGGYGYPYGGWGVIRTVVTATPMAAGATRTVDMAILMAVGVTQVGEHLLW